jgi:hypothetical protein
LSVRRTVSEVVMLGIWPLRRDRGMGGRPFMSDEFHDCGAIGPL